MYKDLQVDLSDCCKPCSHDFFKQHRPKINVSALPDQFNALVTPTIFCSWSPYLAIQSFPNLQHQVVVGMLTQFRMFCEALLYLSFGTLNTHTHVTPILCTVLKWMSRKAFHLSLLLTVRMFVQGLHLYFKNSKAPQRFHGGPRHLLGVCNDHTLLCSPLSSHLYPVSETTTRGTAEHRPSPV